MKKLIVFLIILSSSQIEAQTKTDLKFEMFTLNLTITNIDSGQVTMFYHTLDTSDFPRTNKLIHGRTTFQGKISRATDALIFTLNSKDMDLADPSVIPLILEPGIINVSCKLVNKKIADLKVEGSLSQIERDKWQAEHELLVNNIKTTRFEISKILNDKLKMENPIFKLRLDSLELSLNTLNEILVHDVLMYSKRYPDSYFSGFLLNKYNRLIPLDTLASYFLQLNYQVRNSEFGQMLHNYLYTYSGENFRLSNDLLGLNTALKGVKSLYDVTLRNQFGKKVKLSEYKGKPTLLFFWGTWCLPCQRQFPSLKNLISFIGKNKINFLTISLDSEYENWRKFVNLRKPPGINLIDNKNLLRMFYRFETVSHLIIIDKNGKLINDDAPHTDTPELKKILLSLVDN